MCLSITIMRGLEINARRKHVNNAWQCYTVIGTVYSCFLISTELAIKLVKAMIREAIMTR